MKFPIYGKIENVPISIELFFPMPKTTAIQPDDVDQTFRAPGWISIACRLHHGGGNKQMGMDQYLLIPFLVGWTSIYQLFWGSLGIRVLTHPQMLSYVEPGIMDSAQILPKRSWKWLEKTAPYPGPEQQSVGSWVATTHATRPSPRDAQSSCPRCVLSPSFCQNLPRLPISGGWPREIIEKRMYSKIPTSPIAFPRNLHG